jgi:hypothetical protein
MIPKAGDQVAFAGYGFTVLEVEDNRRVTALIAAPLSAAAATAAAASPPLFQAAIDLLQGEQGNGGRLRDDNGAAVDPSTTPPLLQNSYGADNASQLVFKVASVEDRTEQLSDFNSQVRVADALSPPDAVGSEHATTVAAVDEGDVLIFRDGEWLEPEDKGSVAHSSDFSDSSNFT